MSVPDFSPISDISRSILPRTGNIDNVQDALVFGVYDSSDAFLSGAVEQVSYTYYQLGGDVLDLEITEETVYSAYERAAHEYSYLIDIYQAKNVIGSVMGTQTSSFDQNGNITDGTNEGANTKLPKYEFGYARRLWDAISMEAGVGGISPMYSASITLNSGQQSYDLQELISQNPELSGTVGANRILVKNIYYKSARSSWMFYGFYGGINVMGNMSTYGQMKDDTIYEVVPTSQNKLQAMAYEDSMYVRTSHFSFEIVNNKLRIFPTPHGLGPRVLWLDFMVPGDVWGDNYNPEEINHGFEGVNNINNVPFSYIPFESINYVGKWWIRDYALYLAMLTLSMNRGKLDKVPIPGDAVVLNSDSLERQALEGMEKMREELKEMLDETGYEKLVEQEADMLAKNQEMLEHIPLAIYIK